MIIVTKRGGVERRVAREKAGRQARRSRGSTGGKGGGGVRTRPQRQPFRKERTFVVNER